MGIKGKLIGLIVAFILLAMAVPGWGINDDQIALLRWYAANQTTQFSMGADTSGVAFDGANIWVANWGSGTVSKL
ncbi:MAG: hypothetical protein M0033_11010 [Nitrospiraceae bacterium]|nr:hypothetical protein [Nitrospiraceae bacterium]